MGPEVDSHRVGGRDGHAECQASPPTLSAQLLIPTSGGPSSGLSWDRGLWGQLGRWNPGMTLT